MNLDLTDDEARELPLSKDWKEGIIVKVARTYGQPRPHTEWLPYFIAYDEYKGPDGQVHEALIMLANYRYEGAFRLQNNDYGLRLIDGDAGGHFFRERESNVNIQVGLKSEIEGETAPFYRFINRIPLAGELFEIRKVAEDGSWVELIKSTLPLAVLGKAAPDLQMHDIAGRSFRISDYRGKVLLLDFWASWCKPCIAEFPDIKKMVKSLEKKPLAVVGVNVDEASRVSMAKKVMADNQLTWRQVIEGKGLLHPVCQVFGRLREYGEGFPMYVVIDEHGIARYATKDYRKMGRFLETYFNNASGPKDFLFIPLSANIDGKPKARPVTTVDFTSNKVESLKDSGKLKLPENLSREARLGLLPNGIALIAYPGPTPDKLRVVFDSDDNGNLANEETHDIPVLNDPSPDESKMVVISLRLNYASRAIGFLSWHFYARPADGPGALPRLFFLGDVTHFHGSFFCGDEEYSIKMIDPNGDRLISEEDWSAPGFLKLEMKKGGDWVPVFEGTRRIPIGGSLFKLSYVSDDGELVELEKEK